MIIIIIIVVAIRPGPYVDRFSLIIFCVPIYTSERVR